MVAATELYDLISVAVKSALEELVYSSLGATAAKDDNSEYNNDNCQNTGCDHTDLGVAVCFGSSVNVMGLLGLSRNVLLGSCLLLGSGRGFRSLSCFVYCAAGGAELGTIGHLIAAF